MNTHGNFDIRYENGVFVVRVAEAFNVEGLHALFDAFKTAYAQWQPRRWGFVIDFRNWGGGTRESTLAGLEMAEWNIAHGMVAVAHVVSNPLTNRLTEPITKPIKAKIELASFEDLEKAITWARERSADNSKRSSDEAA